MVAEQETDDADQAIQSYDNTLAEITYAVDHYDGDTNEGGGTHCEAHVGIVTTEMETGAATSESSQENDYAAKDKDTEEEATVLAAQHDDDRLISFIVDSGAQSHNLQDTGAFGLEDPRPAPPDTSPAHRPQQPVRPRLSSTEEESDTMSITSDRSRRWRKTDSPSSFRTWQMREDSRTTLSPAVCLADAACPSN